MDAAGMLEFDKNRGTIELRRASNQAFRYLHTESTAGWTVGGAAHQAAVLFAVPALLIGGLMLNVSTGWLLLVGAMTMVTMSGTYLYAHYQLRE
jgi:hypothetical protein